MFILGAFISWEPETEMKLLYRSLGKVIFRSAHFLSNRSAKANGRNCSKGIRMRESASLRKERRRPSARQSSFGSGASLALPGRALDDLAFLHHEGDPLGRGDIGGRIPGHGDDVGELAFSRVPTFCATPGKSASGEGGGTSASI